MYIYVYLHDAGTDDCGGGRAREHHRDAHTFDASNYKLSTYFDASIYKLPTYQFTNMRLSTYQCTNFRRISTYQFTTFDVSVYLHDAGADDRGGGRPSLHAQTFLTV